MKVKDTKYGDMNGGIYNKSISLCDKNIDSLEGMPLVLNKECFFSSNKITSLNDAPREIKGSAVFANNKLTNLEGNLEVIGCTLNLCHNPLESFGGNIKEIGEKLYIKNIGKFWKSKEQIEQALYEADVKVGGNIYTSFGYFRQSEDRWLKWKVKKNLGSLGHWLDYEE